eukprot:6632665-Pyramimonas_sp.AAC.1
MCTEAHLVEDGLILSEVNLLLRAAGRHVVRVALLRHKGGFKVRWGGFKVRWGGFKVVRWGGFKVRWGGFKVRWGGFKVVRWGGFKVRWGGFK